MEASGGTFLRLRSQPRHLVAINSSSDPADWQSYFVLPLFLWQIKSSSCQSLSIGER